MEDISAVATTNFDTNYELHQKHLTLKGLQPKTIEAYSRAVRRVGDYFAHQIDDLSESDLLDYFADLRETHSWSSLKLDLYGLKFYYEHVLKKPWVAPGLIVASHDLSLFVGGFRRRAHWTWSVAAAPSSTSAHRQNMASSSLPPRTTAPRRLFRQYCTVVSRTLYFWTSSKLTNFAKGRSASMTCEASLTRPDVCNSVRKLSQVYAGLSANKTCSERVRLLYFAICAAF